MQWCCSLGPAQHSCPRSDWLQTSQQPSAICFCFSWRTSQADCVMKVWRMFQHAKSTSGSEVISGPSIWGWRDSQHVQRSMLRAYCVQINLPVYVHTVKRVHMHSRKSMVYICVLVLNTYIHECVCICVREYAWTVVSECVYTSYVSM